MYLEANRVFYHIAKPSSLTKKVRTSTHAIQTDNCESQLTVEKASIEIFGRLANASFSTLSRILHNNKGRLRLAQVV